MRTGPFSKTEVIEKLNAYFVPVIAENEDYGEDGTKSKAEKDEKSRLFVQALEKKLPAGTVHAYVVDTKGEVVASMHVADAVKPEQLIKMLDKTIAESGVKAGEPIVKPKTQSTRPRDVGDGLALHLTSRGVSGGGSWDGVAENWITLTAEQTAKLTPGRKVSVGDKWSLDRSVVDRFFVHFYPVNENNDVTTNKILEANLDAEVVEATDSVVRARLTGKLRMKHAFLYPLNGDSVRESSQKDVVEAETVGMIELIPGESARATGLKLVTVDASFMSGKFEVALCDVADAKRPEK